MKARAMREEGKTHMTGHRNRPPIARLATMAGALGVLFAAGPAALLAPAIGEQAQGIGIARGDARHQRVVAFACICLCGSRHPGPVLS